MMSLFNARIWMAFAAAAAVVLPFQCHAREANNVDHVIHVVVDGLRSSLMDTRNNPNFAWLKANGACTMDARNDPETSQTLPNHIDMFTGQIVRQHGYDEDMDFGALDTHRKYTKYGYEVDGYNLYYGRCCGKKPKRIRLNDVTKEVVRTRTLAPGMESIFDLVASHGRSTGFFGSKDKFDLFRRSWPTIDRFVYNKEPEELVEQALIDIGANHYAFTFLHIINPDGEGHSAGGANTNEYRAAVNEADRYLGLLRNLIQNDPKLDGNTAIILTADHGFANEGNHADFESEENYQIPLCTWGPGVQAGADLYEINESRGVVQNPRGEHGSNMKLIRNAHAAPLAADWLGYTSMNAGLGDQYLAFRADISAPEPTPLPTDVPSTTPTDVINLPTSSPAPSLGQEYLLNRNKRSTDIYLLDGATFGKNYPERNYDVDKYGFLLLNKDPRLDALLRFELPPNVNENNISEMILEVETLDGDDPSGSWIYQGDSNNWSASTVNWNNIPGFDDAQHVSTMESTPEKRISRAVLSGIVPVNGYIILLIVAGGNDNYSLLAPDAKLTVSYAD